MIGAGLCRSVSLAGMGPYSQHFIFFVTYELSQSARVFVTSKPFQPNVMEYSCLLGQLVSYEENKVL
jgi:hypothetical protein